MDNNSKRNQLESLWHITPETYCGIKIMALPENILISRKLRKPEE